MKTSPAGIALIQHFESCRLEAYQDEGGVWTIGWGHTEGVCSGDVVTQHQADILFEQDLEWFERGVDRLVRVPLTQGQFDALVSFAYNVGLDEDTDTKAEGLGDSTLLRKLNAGDYPGAKAE